MVQEARERLGPHAICWPYVYLCTGRGKRSSSHFLGNFWLTQWRPRKNLPHPFLPFLMRCVILLTSFRFMEPHLRRLLVTQPTSTVSQLRISGVCEVIATRSVHSLIQLSPQLAEVTDITLRESGHRLRTRTGTGGTSTLP